MEKGSAVPDRIFIHYNSRGRPVFWPPIFPVRAGGEVAWRNLTPSAVRLRFPRRTREILEGEPNDLKLRPSGGEGRVRVKASANESIGAFPYQGQEVRAGGPEVLIKGGSNPVIIVVE
jgi:hypothetical protein